MSVIVPQGGAVPASSDQFYGPLPYDTSIELVLNQASAGPVAYTLVLGGVGGGDAAINMTIPPDAPTYVPGKALKLPKGCTLSHYSVNAGANVLQWLITGVQNDGA